MARKKLFEEIQPVVDDDEMTKVEAEVKAEIEAEVKAKAREALKKKLRAQAREETGLSEPQEDVTIDLAPYCDRVLIDNVAYLQGQTYTLSQSKVAVIREIMQRTWNHQAEIDGKSENFYRRTRGTRVLPSGAVVNGSQILRT